MVAQVVGAFNNNTYRKLRFGLKPQSEVRGPRSRHGGTDDPFRSDYMIILENYISVRKNQMPIVSGLRTSDLGPRTQGTLTQ